MIDPNLHHQRGSLERSDPNLNHYFSQGDISMQLDTIFQQFAQLGQKENINTSNQSQQQSRNVDIKNDKNQHFETLSQDKFKSNYNVRKDSRKITNQNSKMKSPKTDARTWIKNGTQRMNSSKSRDLPRQQTVPYLPSQNKNSIPLTILQVLSPAQKSNQAKQHKNLKHKTFNQQQIKENSIRFEESRPFSPCLSNQQNHSYITQQPNIMNSGEFSLINQQSGVDFNQQELRIKKPNEGINLIQSCALCKRLENKLLRVFLQFKSFLEGQEDISNSQPSSLTPYAQLMKDSNEFDPLDMLDNISSYLIDLKKERVSHIEEKLKLQRDVSQLIKNQDALELKVKEIDELYKMLMNEKAKLDKKKQAIENILSTQSENLRSYRDELKAIKLEASEFKKTVRRAVEKEVKETIYRKDRDKDYVYEYPLMIQSPNDAAQTQKISREFKDLQPNQILKTSHLSRQVQSQGYKLSEQQLKSREADLDKKESQLYEWEAQLFERKMKIDNMEEQSKNKFERFQSQKQEIAQNLKKLQILTANYEVILQKEYEMSRQAEEISNAKAIIEKSKNVNEELLRNIGTQRKLLQTEQLDAQKVDRYIQRIKEQAQIVVEDNMSFLQREREKCFSRMKEAEELAQILSQEKSRWASGVNEQQKKLQSLVDEKREQVSVMEVSMRQQIKEIRERQELLEKREIEFEEIMKIKNKEIEIERENVEREREDVKCLMLELEEKQGINRSSSKNSKKYKKTNMPRQMPNNQTMQNVNKYAEQNEIEYLLGDSNQTTFFPSKNQKQPSTFKNSHQRSTSQSQELELKNDYSYGLKDIQPIHHDFQDTQDQLINTNELEKMFSNNVKNLLDDEQMLLDDVPIFQNTSSTVQSKTPKLSRRSSNHLPPLGMPPKPPNPLMQSQSTPKLFRKDDKQKYQKTSTNQTNEYQDLLNSQQRAGSSRSIYQEDQKQNQNDLSLDQDQMLEYLLLNDDKNSDKKKDRFKKFSDLNKENDERLCNILLLEGDSNHRMSSQGIDGQLNLEEYLAQTHTESSLLDDE